MRSREFMAVPIVAVVLGADVTGRGEVGSDDPIQAAADALREFAADEIVFATQPD